MESSWFHHNWERTEVQKISLTLGIWDFQLREALDREAHSKAIVPMIKMTLMKIKRCSSNEVCVIIILIDNH